MAMQLYKCTVTPYTGHRGASEHAVIVEADSPVAAYAAAKAATRHLGIYPTDPKVERIVTPQPSIVCTLEGIARKYGTDAVEDARRRTKDSRIYDTADASVPQYVERSKRKEKVEIL